MYAVCDGEPVQGYGGTGLKWSQERVCVCVSESGCVLDILKFTEYFGG